MSEVECTVYIRSKSKDNASIQCFMSNLKDNIESDVLALNCIDLTKYEDMCTSGDFIKVSYSLGSSWDSDITFLANYIKDKFDTKEFYAYLVGDDDPWEVFGKYEDNKFIFKTCFDGDKKSITKPIYDWWHHGLPEGISEGLDEKYIRKNAKNKPVKFGPSEAMKEFKNKFFSLEMEEFIKACFHPEEARDLINYMGNDPDKREEISSQLEESFKTVPDKPTESGRGEAMFVTESGHFYLQKRGDNWVIREFG